MRITIFGRRRAKDSADLPSTATRPIPFVTRIRLLVLGPEELTAIVLWAALIGIGGALASVAFREGIRAIQWLATGQSGSIVHTASTLDGVRRVLVPTLGGLAAGLVLEFGGRLVRATRSIDYMEAVAVGDGVIGARPTVLRALSSLLSIGSGASIGREGPMVQLAALIGSKIGVLRRVPLPRRRLLVACGAAAGIASAYNAPIAAAVFVAEIVMGSFAMESFGPLLVASVSADAMIHRLLGYAPVFQVPAVHFGDNWELILYALLGVLLGHLAPPFLALLDWSKARFAALPVPLFAKLALGGLIVGLISLKYPEVWGNGYSVVDAILHNRLAGALLLGVFLAKVASTASSVGSGAVGGVLTPTLFIGAAVGAAIGEGLRLALPHMTSGSEAFAAVGMGAFLAGTTHAPFTAILLVFEMTLDHQVVLPLILACVTAHYVAKIYRRGASIYRGALEPAVVPGAPTAWRLRTVAELTKRAVSVIDQGMTVRAMLEGLPVQPVGTVYLVDGLGELVATLDPRAVMGGVEQGRIKPESTVLEVSAPARATLTPDLGLTAALEIFLREDASVLPVIASQWRATLQGELSRNDLMLALQERLATST